MLLGQVDGILVGIPQHACQLFDKVDGNHVVVADNMLDDG
jgi:hypothetical protein